MKGTRSYAVSAVCTVIFFILVSLCFSVVNGKTQDPPKINHNQHIFKPSLGLNLRHIEDVIPSALTWNLLFVVALPQKEFQVRNPELDQTDNLAALIALTNQKLRIKICEVNDSVSCRQFHRNIQFILQLSRDQIAHIESLLLAIHDILPRADLSYSNFRQSRSLIPVIGAGMSYLFGLMTGSQGKVLAQQISDVKNMKIHQLNIFHNSPKHLASYIKLSQDRLDKMMDLVTSSIRQSSRMIFEMQNSFTQSLEYFNGLILYTLQLQHQLSTLSTHATNFLAGLQSLSKGQLSTYLTPLSLLQTALDSVAQNLQTTNKYRLVNPDAASLFHDSLFSYLRHGNDIYISLYLPISEFKVTYSIYSVEVLPIILPNSHNEKLVKLAGLPQVIMVSHDYDFHLELTHTELNTLRIHQFHSQQFVFRTDFKQSCLFSAIKNHLKDIDSRCQYHIVDAFGQSEIFHLVDRTYYIYNAPKLFLQCNDQRSYEVPGCLGCVYHLKPNCTLTTGNLYIPATFGTDLSRSEALDLYHTVPYPILRRFLRNDTRFDEWLQTTTLLEAAPQIDLPKMSFFENEMKNKVAKVEQSAISLDRAVQSVHDDSIVMSELSEVILTHDIFSPSDFQWTSPQGIISEVSSIIILIIFITLAYLLVRTHKLAAIVATLSPTLPRVEAQIFGATQAPIRFEFIQHSDSSDGIKSSFLSLTYIDDRLQYFIFLLICLIIALYFLRRLYFQVIRRCLCNMHGSVILQCVHKELCVNFDWNRVPSSPADYQFSSQGPLSNLKIEGYLFPVLSFSFPGFQAVQRHTHEIIEPPTNFRVPFFQALFLRFILSRPDQNHFYIYPLSQFRHTQYALHINDLSPPPIEAIYSTVPEQ